MSFTAVQSLTWWFLQITFQNFTVFTLYHQKSCQSIQSCGPPWAPPSWASWYYTVKLFPPLNYMVKKEQNFGARDILALFPWSTQSIFASAMLRLDIFPHLGTLWGLNPHPLLFFPLCNQCNTISFIEHNPTLFWMIQPSAKVRTADPPSWSRAKTTPVAPSCHPHPLVPQLSHHPLSPLYNPAPHRTPAMKTAKVLKEKLRNKSHMNIFCVRAYFWLRVTWSSSFILKLEFAPVLWAGRLLLGQVQRGADQLSLPQLMMSIFIMETDSWETQTGKNVLEEVSTPL